MENIQIFFKKLTLCMATQWNIMETRKGEDLCHFLGKARQEKKKKKKNL